MRLYGRGLFRSRTSLSCRSTVDGE
jgi:hypothetical protein